MRFVGICDTCSKRMYETRRVAKAAAKTIPGRHMTAYRCPVTDAWHLGHLPLSVVHGARPKAAYTAAVHRRQQATTELLNPFHRPQGGPS